MKRKFLAALVSFCMILTLIPSVSYAAAQTRDIGADDVKLDADSCAGGCQGHIITGKSDSDLVWKQHNIEVSGGTHTIILQNCSILTAGVQKAGFRVEGGANVTLIVEGENRLDGQGESGGIEIRDNSTLTIKGTGSLTANGSLSGAGIDVGTGTNLIISGATVTANGGGGTSGTGSAGIGSGYGTDTNFGNITINGGNVYANGTGGAAAIGGGYQTGDGTANGSITIDGGYVNAKGGKSLAGVTGGAGIGSGENANFDGTITVSGGVVYAVGGANALSIGAGGKGVGENGSGAFSTGVNGNAVIVAPQGIGDVSGYENWDGIFVSYEGTEDTAKLNGNTVVLNDSNANIQVWGDPALDYNLQIDSGTLRIIQNDRNNASSSLTIEDGYTLTNNANIQLGKHIDGQNDTSKLILKGGTEQAKGGGAFSQADDAVVQLPLSKDLITVTGAVGQTYTGEAKEPEVEVELKDLWGYEQTFAEGKDYTVSYKDNTNAGTASVDVTSTGKGNLLGTDTVSTEFNIAQVDFNTGIPVHWSIEKGETELLSELPTAKITVDNSIKGSTEKLKAGTLKWYIDEAHEKEVTDDYLASRETGARVPLYWEYTHEDGNFVSPKSGTMTAVIVEYPAPDVEIGGADVEDGALTKTYGDEDFALEVKISVGDQSQITPSGDATWASDNEEVATVDRSGKVTIKGSGKANITVTVIGQHSEEPYYSDAEGTIALTVDPKPIKVDTTKTKASDKTYDGTTDVEVTAELEEGSIEAGDEGKAELKATGKAKNPNAGSQQVDITYELTGERSEHYVLTPTKDQKTINIYKATPGADTLEPADGEQLVWNGKAQTYNYDLSKLLPKDAGDLELGGNITYSIGEVNIVKDDYFTKDDLKVANPNYLRIPVSTVDSEEEGTIATIEIKIDSRNFNTMTATLTVKTQNPEKYTIRATAGDGGTITPSGEVSVVDGGSKSFEIAAEENYTIKSVTVNGQDVAEAAGKTTYDYTFNNVKANGSISVTFEKNEEPEPVEYTINASAGEGGSITPSGAVKVEEGTSQAFDIQADEDHIINTVTVNGKVIDEASGQKNYTYNYQNVTADGNIEATFTKDETGETVDPEEPPIINPEEPPVTDPDDEHSGGNNGDASDAWNTGNSENGGNQTDANQIGSDKDAAPKTGDEANLTWWLVIALLAASGGFTAEIRRRREN